ncbi:diacylglycerol/lipid kinase family protein [Propionibacteriaceae bacterium Y1700]|uniref:diacylglycerol/lipid kinase family protein n=1 Tax=Microlunatus sp. Y1700 TaxID=3418487 RepID=UPI003DA76240
MTVTVVANPTSGSGRAARMLPTVVAKVRATFADHRIVVRRTTHYDHAKAICQQAAADHGPEDVLIMVGGDGMMHLGLNAVAGTEVALGLIAAGSGDDLCRGLGIDVKHPDQSLTLMTEPPRPVDLIRVDTADGDVRWVGSIVASGFDALVNARANAMTFPKGALQYPAALFAELATFRPLHYAITVDGVRRELESMLIAIGNTTSFGGGIKMCPEADPTDGQLDLTVIHPVSRRLLLRMFPQIYTGTFVSLDEVELLRATTVELDGSYADGRPLQVMGDGEALATAPVTLTLVPGAAQVFRPQ